ncbi:MAG: ABC-F family ATP-binding cassette domain-containing protein [Bacteroidales bacterium]|nr:ABC-F family ATP-binding cassette domain-containing protein [Bacteroidales bacterium]
MAVFSLLLPKFIEKMNYLSIENLTKSYGEKILFRDVSFGLEAGTKAALIAKNGTGKTTLLNIIMGKDIPDGGSITLRNDITVAFLPQEPQLDENLSVFDAILSSDTNYVRAVREYEKAVNQGDADCLQKAISQMDLVGAWDFEYRVKEVLGKLRILNLEKRIAELSGGQKRKIALAKVLLDDIDFLILDEPTNHLDIDMIEWMEGFLLKQNLTLLVVTHDRYFLDNVCNEIFELDRQQIYRYKGNYEFFLEKKAERENAERQEVTKAKNLYRTELEWIRRMPKARTTKSKARIDAFDELSEKASKRLEEKRPEIKVKAQRIGTKILEINNIHKTFDGKMIINNFSYIFKKGERIGVVGPNGSGKSTFFRLIMNQLRPDMGSIVIGQTVVFGYFSQNSIQVNETKRVIDLVKEVAEEIPVGESSTMSASLFLNYFGFDHNTQYNYYQNLSGGEKRRLQLLLSLAHNPNFLIFDEPTNDLDISTLNILEDFLKGFGGCLLIASHDRAFMDQMVDHIFVFEEGGNIKDYHSNYSEYRQKKAQEQRAEVRQQRNEDQREIVKPKKKKPSFKQLKELESIEQEMSILEQRKMELAAILAGGTTDVNLIQKASIEFNEVETRLEEIMLRWIELEEEIAELEKE